MNGCGANIKLTPFIHWMNAAHKHKKNYLNVSSNLQSWKINRLSFVCMPTHKIAMFVCECAQWFSFTAYKRALHSTSSCGFMTFMFFASWRYLLRVVRCAVLHMKWMFGYDLCGGGCGTQTHTHTCIYTKRVDWITTAVKGGGGEHFIMRAYTKHDYIKLQKKKTFIAFKRDFVPQYRSKY